MSDSDHSDYASYTYYKFLDGTGGFMFAPRIGTGLVISKLPDGRWSAPTAIATAGE